MTHTPLNNEMKYWRYKKLKEHIKIAEQAKFESNKIIFEVQKKIGDMAS